MGDLFRISEETIRCPFNQSHQITGLRYHTHIVKCAKQHAGRDVKICPFNAKHIIDTPQYAHHVEHCRDRAKLERHLAEKAKLMQESVVEVAARVEPVQSSAQFSELECWDDDITLPAHLRLASYNPQVATATRDIFRQVTGNVGRDTYKQAEDHQATSGFMELILSFPQEPMGRSSRRELRDANSLLLRMIRDGELAGSEASSETAASTQPVRRPRPRMPASSSLAVATRPSRGRGQKVAAVPLPVGVPSEWTKTAAPQPVGIGRGRGRRT